MLHEYVFDKGMGRGAANNAAVDPAALLDCIRDEFAWAAGKLFGGLEGCVVFVTQLLIAVLRCRGGAPAGGGSSGGQFACDLSSVKQLYGDVAAKFAEHRQAADKLSASARAALEVAESMLLAAA